MRKILFYIFNIVKKCLKPNKIKAFNDFTFFAENTPFLFFCENINTVGFVCNSITTIFESTIDILWIISFRKLKFASTHRFT